MLYDASMCNAATDFGQLRLIIIETTIGVPARRKRLTGRSLNDVSLEHIAVGSD